MNNTGLKALYEREMAIRPPEVLAAGAPLRQAELDALFLDRGEVRRDLVTWRKECPVCGAIALRERAKAKNWPMAECSACGLLTVMALPTSAAWGTYYSTSRAEAMFQRKVFEGTKHKRFATVDEPRAQWVNRLCPAGGRLLDIGCASGAFLEGMSATPGWECHGVDANPEAVKLAREKGLPNVVCAQLEDYAPSTLYDAITLFSVLAQVNDPLRSLRLLRGVLKPGGRVFIADVNFDGFYAAVVGEDHASNLPPIHKNFFTAETMVTLLRSAGFTDIEVQTPGQLDLVRVWMYWKNGGKNGRITALERMIAHELETDSAALQQLIVDSKASEHMWVTARIGDQGASTPRNGSG